MITAEKVYKEILDAFDPDEPKAFKARKKTQP